MSESQLRSLRADFYRIGGSSSISALLWEAVAGESFRYIFWFRVGKWARSSLFGRLTIYPIARLMLRRLKFKFGISIPLQTQIGPGLLIGHFGGIVINPRATIGRNFNLSHGVTIGQANRGRRVGVATIGDNVYVGPGACIVGAVVIGSNCAIGANAVVTNDLPDSAVAGGVPAKIISSDGSHGYVNRATGPSDF